MRALRSSSPWRTADYRQSASIVLGGSASYRAGRMGVCAHCERVTWQFETVRKRSRSAWVIKEAHRKLNRNIQTTTLTLRKCLFQNYCLKDVWNLRLELRIRSRAKTVRRNLTGIRLRLMSHARRERRTWVTISPRDSSKLSSSFSTVVLGSAEVSRNETDMPHQKLCRCYGSFKIPRGLSGQPSSSLWNPSNSLGSVDWPWTTFRKSQTRLFSLLIYESKEDLLIKEQN